MPNESGRLAANQRTLLETMPEMVLVIQSDGSIEYMNPPAASFFKDESLLFNTKTSNRLPATLFSFIGNEKTCLPKIISINKQPFECHIAPFAGYKGESFSGSS